MAKRIRRTLASLFLDKLTELSSADNNSIGNITLRDALGWDEDKYKRVKTQLYDENKIIVGRGHGGTVGLKDSSDAQALSVFISYSHADEELKDKLIKHLTPLQRQGLISTWHDRKLMPGEDWGKNISKNLEEANIVLLLISIDFINSEYCYDIELDKAMELHGEEKLEIIPIILKDCLWQTSPFAKSQALPRDARPVISYASEDSAFAEIAKSIREVAIRVRDLQL